MVDFTKLNDPVWRAQQAELRKQEEEAQAAREKKVSDAMTLCQRNEDALTSVESGFIRSLHSQIVMFFRQPTDKQEKWLFDIAARFAPTVHNDQCTNTESAGVGHEN